MFTVIAKKTYKAARVASFDSWTHTTPEDAVAHAEARARFTGSVYLVLHNDAVIYIAGGDQ